MRRHLTEEQKAAAAQRRAGLRKLARQIAHMTPEERGRLAERSWPTTIEGHRLSVHNACLVALQAPGATVLGGYRQWINAGRAVQKGQHGIGIWCPISDKPEEGNEEEEPTEIRFLFGTVFDVSQTAEILTTAEVAAMS